MTRPAKVAIIGGGISGLAAAYFIEQRCAELKLELKIDLFEAQSSLGGKLSTLEQNGLRLELGAESFLSRKPAGIEFCRALGIADQLRGTRPENKKTFIWYRERMHQIPQGLTGFVPGNLFSLFSTSLLSLGGKLRVAADYMIPSRRSNDDESLASFMTRRLGTQAYQRLVQPLLCGIYSGDGEQLSLAATYPELRQLESENGSLVRGLRRRQKSQKTANAGMGEDWPAFVTLPGGMSELIKAVDDQLKLTQNHLGCPITGLVKNQQRWRLHTRHPDPNWQDDDFDAVVACSSATVTSSMVASLAPNLSSVLVSIPHVSTATVNLWYEAKDLGHDLDGYGFVIPTEEQNGVTAVTWTSSKHFDRSPGNLKLIRAYLGRAGAEFDSTLTDDQVMEIVQRELKRTMGITRQPSGQIIQRWPNGSPQYTLGHLEKLKQIDQELTELPGLYLCGSSYRGVGIPDCIRDGRQIAEQVVHQLTNRS